MKKLETQYSEDRTSYRVGADIIDLTIEGIDGTTEYLTEEEMKEVHLQTASLVETGIAY